MLTNVMNPMIGNPCIGAHQKSLINPVAISANPPLSLKTPQMATRALSGTIWMGLIRSIQGQIKLLLSN